MMDMNVDVPQGARQCLKFDQMPGAMVNEEAPHSISPIDPLRPHVFSNKGPDLLSTDSKDSNFSCRMSLPDTILSSPLKFFEDLNGVSPFKTVVKKDVGMDINEFLGGQFGTYGNEEIPKFSPPKVNMISPIKAGDISTNSNIFSTSGFFDSPKNLSSRSIRSRTPAILRRSKKSDLETPSKYSQPPRWQDLDINSEVMDSSINSS